MQIVGYFDLLLLLKFGHYRSAREYFLTAYSCGPIVYTRTYAGTYARHGSPASFIRPANCSNRANAFIALAVTPLLIRVYWIVSGYRQVDRVLKQFQLRSPLELCRGI